MTCLNITINVRPGQNNTLLSRPGWRTVSQVSFAFQFAGRCLCASRAQPVVEKKSTYFYYYCTTSKYKSKSLRRGDVVYPQHGVCRIRYHEMSGVPFAKLHTLWEVSTSWIIPSTHGM